MFRNWMMVLVCAALALPVGALADVVTDWNRTVYDVIQSDGLNVDNKSNPGWSTRTIAMLNGAIYDVFQAVNRTHSPYLVNSQALPGTSLEAAVHQAAYEILSHCYPSESSILDANYGMWMAPEAIPDGIAKTNGMNLGHTIAAQYKAWRANDHADEMYDYTPGTMPGEWRPDPFWPGLPDNPQTAWGPGWRHVQPFAIDNTAAFVNQLPPIPDLNSDAYTQAFNQVKEWGALESPSRDANPEYKEIALFWAYDRPAMGPPPALFVRSLREIAEAAGKSPEENARLFALASMSMADAAIAAWDTKFEDNFWRPVTAIHEAGVGGPGDADGNPDTIGDPTWRPMGAPGADHGGFADDFTPPFPAWTSGHATMGGALFKAIELFYGTNSFGDIIGIPGSTYTLTSEEAGSGGPRDYTTFTQTGLLDIGLENSPEGENGTSRIYLGIHWIFDQRDGITLGNSIASYVAGNYFQLVPEPSAIALGMIGFACVGLMRRQRS